MKKILLLSALVISFTLSAQKFEWANSLGGSAWDMGKSVCVDADGNVYTTGSFKTNDVDFDPGPDTYYLSSAGLDDVFVQKLDADGNFVWAKSFGSTGDDSGNFITVGSDGNIYTSGHFEGTIDFDSGAGVANLSSFSGSRDIFIQKLDADGNFIWVKHLGNSNYDNIWGFDVDADGNVYSVGYFKGTYDFDPGPESYSVTSVDASYDIYIQKLDTDGNLVWVKTIGGATSETARELALDADGNIFISGTFHGTVDFDSGVTVENLTAYNYGTWYYLLKLDTEGDFVWVKAMGATKVNSICADPLGNILVTGFFEGSKDVDFGSGVDIRTSAGEKDIIVMKLNSSGNYEWSKTFGDATNDSGASINLDAEGNIYTLAYFEGEIDFDPGIGATHLKNFNGSFSYTYPQYVVHKMDASGNFIWVGQVEEDVEAMRIAGTGDIYLTGKFYQTVDFDAGEGTANLTAATEAGQNFSSSPDAFTQRISPCTPSFGTDIHVSCDSYTWIDEKTYTESNNTATYFLTSATGCDSIVTLDLTINESTSSTDVQISCSDYSWIDGNTYTESNNTATYLLTNAAGCDSLITLDLTINVPTSATDFQTASSSYTWIDGNSYSASNNTATHTLTNVDGCDSIVTLHLTINENSPGVTMAYEWGSTITNIDYEISTTAIGTDSQGDIYLAGVGYGATDYDPGPGETILEGDFYHPQFIQKLDSSGSFLWARKNNYGTSYVADMVVNGSDELIMVGEYYDYAAYGSVDLSFGDDSFIGEFASGKNRHMFVMKTDADGELIWGLSFMNEDYAGASKVTTDTDGNIYFTGSFKGIVDFDPGLEELILEAPDSFLDTNTFVIKLSSSGVFEWAKEIDGISKPSSIALGQNNEIVVAGYYKETVDFDPGVNSHEITSAGDKDGFVLQLDQNGDFDWVIPFASTGTNVINDLTTDQDGNVYTIAKCEGTVDVDPGVDEQLLSAETFEESFIVKYNNNGEYLWSQHFQGTIFDIIIDESGSICYSGLFVEDIDVDFGTDEFLLEITDIIPVPSASPEVRDAFVLKTDQDGGFIWASPIVGNFKKWHQVLLAADASDHLIAFGEFEDKIYIDPNEEVQSYYYSLVDVYTIKFEPCIKTNPEPLVENLPDRNNCFLSTINPPQAINDCGEIFTASTNGVLLEESGAIEWVYEDGYGNGFSQIQYVNSLAFDVIVNQTGHILSAGDSGYSYQWLDCNNNMAPIEGAIFQEYIATEEGTYALEIGNGLCRAISDCYEVDVSGNDFLSFAFAEQTGPATIDSENKLITIEVQSGTDPTSLIPTFSVSPNATTKIDDTIQESGISVNDYSTDVIYTVYNEDGIGSNWRVQLSVSTALTYYVSGGGIGTGDGLSMENAAAYISVFIDTAVSGDSIVVMSGLVTENTNLSISEGVLVYLMEGAVVDMDTYNLENNGHITLSATAALVQGTGSSVSGTGVFEIIRQSDNNPEMFNFLSSPIDNIHVQAVFGGSNVLSFDPEDHNNGLNGWTYLTSGFLTNAQGIAVNGSITIGANGKRHYQGMVNNGNISIELDGNVHGGSFDGWNLVGNPYPSAINMNNFINSNADVGAITIYDQSLNSYQTFNTINAVGLEVASGQGFFVEFSEASSGTVLFENAHRNLNGSGTIQRSSQIARSLLRIKNETSYYDSYIAFTDNATDGYNHTYDARLIPGAGATSLYSILDEEAFAIQTLETLNKEKTIPLGFSSVSGFHTIELLELTNFGSEVTVLLVDHEAAVTHQLNNEPYTFVVSETGVNETRFELRYQPVGLNIEGQSITSNLYLSVEDQSLYVYGLEDQEVESILIFDVNGKQLINTTKFEQSAQFIKTRLKYLDVGIYFVEIHTNKGIEVLQLPIVK